MSRIYKFLRSSFAIAFTLTTFVFTFVPDSLFSHGFIHVDFHDDAIIACNKLLCLTSIAIVTIAGKYIYKRWIQTSCFITGNGYKIVVEYGDLFDKTDCKKVISFDECYTTHVGELPSDIKASSICGQFLAKYPDEDFKQIIQSSGLEPSKKRSEYQKKECYKSGSIVPYNEYLLLAFTKLDKDGLGRMSREDFLQCLDYLWMELDQYHADQSVAIPILGSGVTGFKDETLLQQQLLDMIIASYKLSPYKMKSPSVLHIVCRKNEYFSLNKIGEYI